MTARASADLDGAVIRVHANAAQPREVDRLVDRLGHRLERAAVGWEARRGRVHIGEPSARRGSGHPPRPEEREIIRHTTASPAACSVDDAVAEMDDLGQDFHLFVEATRGSTASSTAPGTARSGWPKPTAVAVHLLQRCPACGPPTGMTSDRAGRAVRLCTLRLARGTLVPVQAEEGSPMTTSDTWHLAAPPEARDDDPPVTTVMTSHIVGITADAGLATALRLMAIGGVRHLPVFDGTRCCGLLLETDVVDHLIAGVPAERSMSAIARLVRPAPAVTTAARRSDAARGMQNAGVDAVLVTERKRLVGIVTATDLIRSLALPADDRAAARSPS